MTVIVLEGPDNSGKSTLAKAISDKTGLSIISSEGREKYPGEINSRVRRYLDTGDNLIYDRHPVISQRIYSLVAPNTPIEGDLIKEFYSFNPVFIYCKAINGLNGHIIKPYDTEEYLTSIKDKYSELEKAYDNWALQEAHLIYRIGDSIEELIKRINNFNPVDDIDSFHLKFNLAYKGEPRALPSNISDFRVKFLNEEYQEYVEAVENYYRIENQPCLPGHEGDKLQYLEKAFDALIDLVYVALGTSYLHGFPFIEGWNRVHKANMAKIRAKSKDESKRSSSFDVIKPEGWAPPSLIDLIRGY